VVVDQVLELRLSNCSQFYDKTRPNNTQTQNSFRTKNDKQGGIRKFVEEMFSDHQKGGQPRCAKWRYCASSNLHTWVQSDGDVQHPQTNEITPCLRTCAATCSLDGFGGTGVTHIHNIINMVTQRNKQVKEKLPSTLHFYLHGTTPPKCLATSNN